ncbi:hypothetical protein DRJ48_03505 [Candidatus Woesearchaeota archaeon]|nr:MAG: hypothetical protein DRJ48_03505 [Candidatus Woesearchaeota archaeon]
MRNKQILLTLGVFVLGFTLLGFHLVRSGSPHLTRVLTLNPYYTSLVYLLVGLALAAVVASFFTKTLLRFIKNPVSKFVYFVVLLPAAILPIFRCYFRVPYLFCHLCPRKCVFGVLRAYVVPMAVVMNLKNRFFCYNVCPIGKVQTAQVSCNPRMLRRNSIILSSLFLILAGLLYFVVNPVSHPQLFDALFKGRYSFSFTVVGVALAIILLSFLVARVWCDNICPIGGFARIFLTLKALFRKNAKEQ